MKTSNEWDEEKDEGGLEWTIQKIVDFRKRGNKEEYFVIYEPRVFPADEEFPEELPAVSGLPWELDERNWQPARSVQNNSFSEDSSVELRSQKERSKEIFKM